jgi:hypothetical protein
MQASRTLYVRITGVQRPTLRALIKAASRGRGSGGIDGRPSSIADACKTALSL